MTLLDECGDIRIFQEELVEPRDLGEHLQIGEVLRLKIFFGPFGGIARAAKSLPQFMVARIAADHVHRIRLKQILQGETAFVGSQVFRRRGRDFQERIVRRSGHVVLDLRNQRGDEIESLVNVGKLVQQFDHPIVVFQGVQAHPGQTVFPRDQIFVERLMLVPKNDDAQSWHGA